ncbi:MAG: protoporphyrinogen oxidase [Candidatus Melainabacteria bacterium]|nr:protoporphyrinogen oxidase [Candidatus Melainabacteria bacterium]
MVTTRKKVVIIGGGITGLAAAFRLKYLSVGKSLDISIVEAAPRLGGVIETVFSEDCLLECGPDSMLSTKPAGVRLMKELGMENQIIETCAENRRAFIAAHDCLLPMPEGFRLIAPESVAALAASPCLSVVGKLRAVCEPFVPRHAAMSNGELPDDFDESLSSFVRRRLGEETLERLAQPLFSGIYTADPENLSMRATMPQFLEYEAEFGSVVKGLREKGKAATGRQNGKAESVRYSMFVAPERGMGSLVNALEKGLKGVSIHVGKSVATLSFHSSDNQWRIESADGSVWQSDAIVMCLPAKAAAKLLSDAAPEAAQHLCQISYASSAVINFIVERENVLHPLDGFGFVVPALLKRNLLAGSFSSVKFRGRAPSHLVILRAFVGGALFPQMMELSDSEMCQRAFADLSFYLSIRSPARGRPFKEALVSRWYDSMPQYAVGHRKLVKNIEHEVSKLTGAFICGSAYEGVGIPDCIANAESTARSVFDSLFPI